MAKKSRLLALFAGWFFCSCCWAISTGDLSAFVDGFVESRMAEHGVVGTTVSIVHDGRMVFAKGYGYDDLASQRPVEADRSLFRPGSISKTFTWTAVMQLYERGLIDLEADIQTYLPNVSLPRTFGSAITMLDLMAHRTGFEDSALGHLFMQYPAKAPALQDYLNHYQPQQVREPGGEPSYSNYGSALAGQIVANISGMPFEDYIEANITGPLGMVNATFREPGLKGERAMNPAMAKNVSRGYIRVHGTLDSSAFNHVSHIAPAGALSATATDMAKWMLTHLDDGTYQGRRILQTETARLMHSTHFSPHPALPGMAHGFIESHTNGYHSYGHNGGTIHFLSDMVIIPELRLGIFISTNTTDSGSKLIDGFAAAVASRYFPPGPYNLQATETNAEDLKPYLGTYTFNRHSFSTLEKVATPIAIIGATTDGKLTFGDPGKPYERVGEHLFQRIDQPDKKIAFITDDNGRLDGFYPGSAVMVAHPTKLKNNPLLALYWLIFAGLVFIAVLIGAWLRRKRQVQLKPADRWSARLLYFTSIVWLVAIGMFAAAFAEIDNDFRLAFFGFPSSLLTSSLTVILIACALTGVCILMLRTALTSNQWSGWRRLRHLLVVATMLTTVYVAFQFNAIGYNYF